MSDAIQTTPGSRILFNDRRFLDDDVLDGDVLVKSFACRLDLFDLVDDIGAFDHLAEYRVAPAAGGGGGEVQEFVIGNVNEKLSRGGVRIAGTRHGDGVFIVIEPVVGFIFYRLVWRFLFHAWLNPRAIENEII